MCPRIIRTPTLGLIFEEKNAYYTRKITVAYLWVLEIITFVMENVMEKSWNFVLGKLYEPCRYTATWLTDIAVAQYGHCRVAFCGTWRGVGFFRRFSRVLQSNSQYSEVTVPDCWTTVFVLDEASSSTLDCLEMFFVLS